MGKKPTVGRTEQTGRELQKFRSSEGGQKYRQGVEENKIEETAYLQLPMAFQAMLTSPRRKDFEQKSEPDAQFRNITRVLIKTARIEKRLLFQTKGEEPTQ